MFKKKAALSAVAAVLLTGCLNSACFGNTWNGEEVKEGDRITLGMWETKKKEGNAQELSWKVLEIMEDQALILSEEILEAVPWSTEAKEDLWENSFVRSWLNDVFYAQAFSADEQERIFRVRLSNPANAHYDTGEGADTEDKVFLLSEEEVRKHLPDPDARKAEATAHAQEQDIYISEVTDTSFWWLRTTGDPEDEDMACAMCVGPEGSIVQCGYPVPRPDFGVRPAMWIKLKK